MCVSPSYIMVIPVEMIDSLPIRNIAENERPFSLSVKPFHLSAG